MKYIVIYCIAITTTSPAIYKKDRGNSAVNKVIVHYDKADSLKFNSINEVNVFLDQITPEVHIKQIKTSTK